MPDSANSDALDELEAKPKNTSGSRRKPVAKKEVKLDAQTQKELDRKVEDAVDSVLEKKATSNEAEADYRKNGGRRWRCKVNSTRAGVQHFEMMIADPRNPKRPVVVRGRCGVIIEKGLTKHVIDCLKGCYRTETNFDEFIPNDSRMGTQHAKIRIPNYSVEVFEEIENPDPVGKVK